jgi:hypothetical protein
LKPSELIADAGWCQHTSTNAKGEVCLVGAFDVTHQVSLSADLDDRHIWLQSRLVYDFEVTEMANMLFPTERGWGCAVEFNDHPGRTKEDVLLVLKHLGL